MNGLPKHVGMSPWRIWENHRRKPMGENMGFSSRKHGHDCETRLDHMFKKMVLGVAHLGRDVFMPELVVSLEIQLKPLGHEDLLITNS